MVNLERKISPKEIPEPDLLSAHIKPGHAVIVIGGGTGLFGDSLFHASDPSVAHVCTLVKPNSGGRVILVDSHIGYPIDAHLERKVRKQIRCEIPKDELEKMEATRGWGAPFNQQAEIQAVKNANPDLEISIPEIHIANAFKTRLPTGFAHVILDRNTSSWVVNRPEKEAEDNMPLLVDEYLRLLHPGGKIIMLFDSIHSEVLGRAKKALAARNAVVKEYRLKSGPYDNVPYVIAGKKYFSRYACKHALVAQSLTRTANFK